MKIQFSINYSNLSAMWLGRLEWMYSANKWMSQGTRRYITRIQGRTITSHEGNEKNVMNMKDFVTCMMMDRGDKGYKDRGHVDTSKLLMMGTSDILRYASPLSFAEFIRIMKLKNGTEKEFIYAILRLKNFDTKDDMSFKDYNNITNGFGISSGQWTPKGFSTWSWM